MAVFNKEDLVFSDYIWNTRYNNDDPKVTGKPDSTLFNRHEGWEMLYLINVMMVDGRILDKNFGKKIEQMIRKHLPGNIRSQENVRDWLFKNWQYY